MDAQTQAWLDQDDSRMAATIREHGWSIEYIGGDECSRPGCDCPRTDDPPFAYTVGLFGMAHPEGYRKALRLMQQAEKFGRPVVTFIDTPGAYPGLGSEERGVAQAIALNLREMARLKVPLVSVIIGEGGSGGALGLGVTDRILMLEHSIYSVISPEGCAAILWHSRDFKAEAAAALKITSKDLVALGVADEVIPEPSGGAHSDWDATTAAVKESIERNLEELGRVKQDRLLKARWAKYETIGAWGESAADTPTDA